MAIKTIYMDDHDGKTLDDGTEVKVIVGDRMWKVTLSDKNMKSLQDTVQGYVPDVQASLGVRETTSASERARGQRGPNRTPEQIAAAAKEKEDRANQRKEIIAFSKKDASLPDVGDRGRVNPVTAKAFYAANPSAEQFYA